MRAAAACFLIPALWATSALSEDAEYGRVVKAATDAAFGHMAITFLCQKQIGASHYQAAKTIAESTMVSVGYGSDESVVFVDEMDQKFRSDKRPSPARTFDTCITLTNESLQRVKVARAKFRIFVEKQKAEGQQ